MIKPREMMEVLREHIEIPDNVKSVVLTMSVYDGLVTVECEYYPKKLPKEAAKIS